MKGFRELSAVAFSLLACTVRAEDVASDGAPADAPSDVHVLGTESFESFVSENPLVLAEFYAPWCGHCKALAPEYEDAATKLKEKKIHLAKIDCTVEAQLCEAHGVQGYPTLKVFRGQNSSPYTGPRKSDGIVSYMIKQSLPAVSILDKKSYDDFIKADKVVLVAYFGADDKETNATYSAVAENLRDSYLFGATNDESLAKAAGVTAPALVLYKTFDEGKAVFDGKFDVESIVDFAKTASTPLVGEVGPETYTGYMEAGIPLLYLFVDNEADKEKLTTAVKPLAQKYRGKINFATIDAVAFGAHAPNLNLEQKWPAIAIQEIAKNQKFPFDQSVEITDAALTAWVEDFVAGKLSPSIKSEPIPETQEGPVYVVVAHNYDDIVLDETKDVLVEYYAPWCGHCKNLAPKYEELGHLYFDNKDFASKVAIAKVDATLNDVPVEIQGFPTIKLFPAGAKNAPIDYTGSRTVEDLAKFVYEHGTNKVNAYVAPPPPADEEEEEEEEEEDVHGAAPAATEEPASTEESISTKEAAPVEETPATAEESAAPSATEKKKPEGHDEL